ncbi:alanyl-tRNA editing protein [archaeon]|nr:alanyl-tRNA editing protein [archaeon]
MISKIFYENPLQDTCTAKVTNIENNTIQLDQTIFFAFSGGQASDHGTINGIAVVKATKISEEIIEYELEQAPNFQVADIVDVKIDLDRRKLLMRLHSAAHIVCFVFEEMTGIHYSKCIGSSVDVNKARLDYSIDNNISEYFEELTEKVNNIFTSDHPINTFANKEDSTRREWECPTLNQACPCGGTHVSNTNKIGKVRFKRKNTGKGKERIEIILIDAILAD